MVIVYSVMHYSTLSVKWASASFYSRKVGAEASLGWGVWVMARTVIHVAHGGADSEFSLNQCVYMSTDNPERFGREQTIRICLDTPCSKF